MNWKRWLSALAAAAVGGVAGVGGTWATGEAPTSGKGVAITLGFAALAGVAKFLMSRESEDAAKPDPTV